MNYNEILLIAKQKLDQINISIIKDFESLITAGSTGGEIAAMVGKYLKDLETLNYHAYILLKQDIIRYIAECKKNGLIIFRN